MSHTRVLELPARSKTALVARYGVNCTALFGSTACLGAGYIFKN